MRRGFEHGHHNRLNTVQDYNFGNVNDDLNGKSSTIDPSNFNRDTTTAWHTVEEAEFSNNSAHRVGNAKSTSTARHGEPPVDGGVFSTGLVSNRTGARNKGETTHITTNTTSTNLPSRNDLKRDDQSFQSRPPRILGSLNHNFTAFKTSTYHTARNQIIGIQHKPT